ncbi:MAG: hypothetical protein GEU76_07940 [Alphaproteobacteria bacterium]|nr:hypothetical protein [Alphaproteobacteria bacterium]
MFSFYAAVRKTITGGNRSGKGILVAPGHRGKSLGWSAAMQHYQPGSDNLRAMITDRATGKAFFRAHGLASIEFSDDDVKYEE